LQIYGIKSHRSPSSGVPSLAEHGGDDMYAINMQAARWKVHLRCSQFTLYRFNTLYLD
jgi:hypothetical protein